MKLSKRTQYAIRALVCFADAYEAGFLQAKELSAREKLPAKFLETILHALTRSRYLVSRIGANGGYRLARPPRDILLGDVIIRLEGRLEEQDATPGQNDRPGEVAVRIVQARLEDAIHAALSATTLADLAEEVARTDRPGEMFYI
jgi:Rrf2 family protein